MLGISTSGGVGFTAKVHPHRYGYVGRLVGQRARKLPDLLSEEDRRRIGVKVAEGDWDDVLEDIRLSEGGALYSLDTREKSHRDTSGRRGTLGMSRRTRHTVRGSIVALASLVPDGCLSFFTATCPEIDYLTDGSVASNWNKVVDNFVKRLRRLLKASGCPDHYCHVTEIQPKRWAKTSKPYLHLHLVFQGRRTARSPWAVSYEQLRKAWVGALNSVVEDDPYYTAVCDVRPCDKGISRYLSKYLSKGSGIAREVISSGLAHWFPKQWWGCARSVVAEREALTYRARGAEAGLLFNTMQLGGANLVEWLHPVMMEDAGGREFLIGYCFTLTPSAYTSIMTSQSMTRAADALLTNG